MADHRTLPLFFFIQKRPALFRRAMVVDLCPGGMRKRSIRRPIPINQSINGIVSRPPTPGPQPPAVGATRHRQPPGALARGCGTGHQRRTGRGGGGGGAQSRDIRQRPHPPWPPLVGAGLSRMCPSRNLPHTFALERPPPLRLLRRAPRGPGPPPRGAGAPAPRSRRSALPPLRRRRRVRGAERGLRPALPQHRGLLRLRLRRRVPVERRPPQLWWYVTGRAGGAPLCGGLGGLGGWGGALEPLARGG